MLYIPLHYLKFVHCLMTQQTKASYIQVYLYTIIYYSILSIYIEPAGWVPRGFNPFRTIKIGLKIIFRNVPVNFVKINISSR